MHCQSCGHDNKPEYTFCAKCLEILSDHKPILTTGKHSVVMPPQNDHLVDIQYSSPPTEIKPVWVWVVVILAAVSIIVFVLYG